MSTNTDHENRFIGKCFAFARKRLKCHVCNSNKVGKDIGDTKSQCNQCRQSIAYFNPYCTQIIERYIVKPFIAHLVQFTALAFFTMTFVAFYDPIPAKIAGAVSIFGFIFVALKFKLDQASYQKDLFQRRYELFLVINDVLTSWSEKAKSTNEMLNKINGDLMRQSYFLFGKQTYEFVREFRQALIYTKTSINETDDLQLREEIKLARDFLGSIMSGQKLADKFPELKINYYST